jgi:hypothetical protein
VGGGGDDERVIWVRTCVRYLCDGECRNTRHPNCSSVASEHCEAEGEMWGLGFRVEGF